MAKKLLVWFKDVDREDVALVGGKGANLGEMTKAGFPVPPGFIVTAYAYQKFLEENDFILKIQHLLGTIDYSKNASLENASKKIKKLITSGTVSEELVKEVFAAYATLSGTLKNCLVAVRSSATAEDLPNASFAGQQETFLNVKGEASVLLRIKDAWASLFEPRAIFYRHENKFDHARVYIAVPIQKMVESNASGVVFSLNPVNNDKSTIVVEAIYGLGELIVQGEITPDHYEIAKDTLEITKKEVAEQKIMLIKKGLEDKKVSVPSQKRKVQKISDKHIKQIAELSRQLEKHYYFPQDSEWAIQGDNVYLVQTRPITTVKNIDKEHTVSLEPVAQSSEPLLKGDGASPGIATGPVTILESAKEIGKLHIGDVLIAPQTNPDYVPAMKKAVAIVTENGGRTSHAAIVARELGIPAVVGTKNVLKTLKDGEIITVNGATGAIYKGGIPSSSFIVNRSSKDMPRVTTATKVYVNLAEPELAQHIAQQHVDGIGLLRAEFMMAQIGVHPKKAIHDGKKQEYIKQLAAGIGEFCKSFSPRPVVYRASDFKTNEYRNLIGGKSYEPEESNPMLGFRGAYRYTQNPDVFELELEAIKQVRNKMGLKNVWLMIPFVRTVKELEEVKSLIAASGLYRSPSFKLWMMVEIPSNVILLEEFIKAGIDGVSIGSNDLTMLLLGTDRDNSEVARAFNEQDESVLWAFEHVVTTAHKYHITSSLCGQAASLYPSLLEKLVKWGITSVSVSPDMIDQTREEIATFEREMIQKHGKN